MTRTSARAVLLAVVAIGGLLASARPASAYVREVTQVGCHPLHWDQTCIYVTSDADPMPQLPLADIERLVGRAVEGWQTALRGQSFLQLRYTPASGRRETVADGFQVIKFRSDRWCRPAEGGGEPICYDPAATALTTLTYVRSPDDPETDGRITDADIELNAVDNYFYDADAVADPANGDRVATDLWNTLSHELGHLLGLEESCRLGFEPPACARDGNGDAVIDCVTVENGRATDPALQAIYDTTMYALGKPREIRKRNPKADDVAGVVAGSPLRDDPEVCGVPGDAGPETTPPSPAAPASAQSGGCAVASPSAPSALGLLGIFALWRWRRRRR